MAVCSEIVNFWKRICSDFVNKEFDVGSGDKCLSSPIKDDGMDRSI
jgi:hypothetical protein